MKEQVELTTFMSQVNTLVKLARTKLLTLTRIQPGHHNVVSRRSSAVYSVGFVSHSALVRAIVKDMSSLLVFIISAVWILDTSIPIPVSHLTWVLQFPRAWETQCCFDFGWTHQDIVNQG